MSTLTRKQYNRAAADAARKAGVYSIVMGEWDRLDRTLPPKAAVKALAVLLAPEEPAKAPKASKPAKVEAKPEAKVAPKLERVSHQLTLTPLKVRAAIEAGMDAPASEGRFQITVTVDGRYRAAKVLKEAGFEVKSGQARIWVNDGEQVARAVTRSLAVLFRDCGLWGKGQPGNVTGLVYGR